MTAGGARGEGGWLAAWVPGEVLGCPCLLEAEGWVYLAGLLSAPCILDAWLGLTMERRRAWLRQKGGTS